MTLVNHARAALRAATAFLVFFGTAQAAEPAADPLLSQGKQLYRQSCAVCHEAGVARAPKVGDKRRWAALLRERPAVVTAHGWVGYGGMPARGGSADATPAQFFAAVTYMARSSGQADWPLPGEQQLAEMSREVAKRERQLAARAKVSPGKASAPTAASR
jgi:cytochrome c5